MGFLKSLFFRSDKNELDSDADVVIIGSTGRKATAASNKYFKTYDGGNNSLSKPTEENYLHKSELVFSAIDYISKAASQAIPVIVEVDPVTNERKPVKKKQLQEWIQSPNQFQTWGELIELVVQGLLLSGNSFVSVELVSGRFESWHLGPPSKVKVVPDPKDYIKGYIYLDSITYDTTDVIHFRNPTLNNIYYGVPAVRPLLDTLLLESDSIEELKKFYGDSSILTGVLQSEYNLQPEQITAIREQFDSLHGKNGKARRGTAVLPQNLKYTPIQATPKDAMLLESLGVSETRVLRLFKLNKLVIGGEASSASHPQELMKATFNTAVRPYLYRLQDQMTTFIRAKLKNPRLEIYFDLDRITELDTPLDTKAASAKTLYSTGVASLNEARDLLGLPRLDEPNADKHILASYLFGQEAAYIEDGANPSQSMESQSVGVAGSTDPHGGAADMPTTDSTTSPNR